ncbi:TIGR00366 family protein [Fontibacter flavus]|uniref:TIGR00366 family protein n=1 Tax=Fontibacter flavus TaxID=654838 RepID=A0ABV6FU74_9BACT
MKKKLKFPSTFEIALLLSLVVFLFALFLTKPQGDHYAFYAFNVLKFWQQGFWELLEFTMQMVLILVFGHALAISRTIDKWLGNISAGVQSNRQAVLITGLVAIFGGYINWGFGLVLGAVLAKKIGEEGKERGVRINYPLVGAAGYLGMLVWHGGLSGSATLKVAERDHFLANITGIIPINQTIFSEFNLWINAVMILVLIFLLVFLSKKKVSETVENFLSKEKVRIFQGKDSWGFLLGLLILLLVLGDFLQSKGVDWSFVDLNFVNFVLLGAGLFAYKSLEAYVKALGYAVKGATDIVIQFPFYAGILGMMKYSGLLVMLADDMVMRSSADSFPLLAFLSSALINLFVPSGGGQWAIQGPVIMEASMKMGLDLSKMIMAFAFGDQLTNMLQPFWALPLLSITGIPAKEIFRYTFYFFIAGLLVFGLGIWFFVG